MDFSIIIPAYNEENRIGETLKKIQSYFLSKNYNYQIIVVDDGSRDRTSQIVEKFSPDIILLKNEKNYGKGYSIKRGVEKAEGNFILFTDADLSTPIEEIEKLLVYLVRENYDIAIGSRGLKESKIVIHQPFYREYAGKFFNLLVKLFIMNEISDTQCGFKCFKGNVAKKLFSKSLIYGFAFDVEILYIAKIMGYKIKEVPIVWYNSKMSKVSILKHPLQMIYELVKIKYYTKLYKGEKNEFTN